MNFGVVFDPEHNLEGSVSARPVPQAKHSMRDRSRVWKSIWTELAIQLNMA